MPAWKKRWVALAIAAASAVSITGCAAAPRLYVNRLADMTFYKRVAVLPFASLGGDPYAGARVTRAMVTELVIADRFQLVDPAAFAGELSRIGAIPDMQGNVDAGKLKDAAEKVQATGIIRGAVTEYGTQRVGGEDFPVVSFDAELVDVQTGNTVWRISVTGKGRGRLPVIGGASSRSFGRVTEEACQRAVALLQQKAF